MKHKKILIIAYHFPPDAAVGALRPQKFVKYLPEFGWQPYVLTIKEKYIQKNDPTRLKDVQDVPVFRTTFFETPLRWFVSLKKKVFKNKCAALNLTDSGAGKQQVEEWKLPTNPFKKFIFEADCFPDEKKGWIFPAVIRGYVLVKKFDIKVIYTTSPPHSVDIIGLMLAKLTGCKLVVDHRDPWAFCQPRQETPFFRALHHYIEKLVLRNASAIITTTGKYADELANIFPAFQNKIHAIPNGYDPADFDFASMRADDKFTITHVGTFYLDRSPEYFFRALKGLIDEDKHFKQYFQVNLVGSNASIGGRTLEGLIRENGLDDIVRIVGTVPYQQSLQYILNSDALLLFAPNQPLQIPGKTFEYLAARVPILAFTEEGATADMIARYKAGLCVLQEDVSAIKDAVRFIVSKSEEGNYFYKDVDLSELERRSLTGKLAEIMDRLV